MKLFNFYLTYLIFQLLMNLIFLFFYHYLFSLLFVLHFDRSYLFGYKDYHEWLLLILKLVIILMLRSP
jgi:hypothetical protein